MEMATRDLITGAVRPLSMAVTATMVRRGYAALKMMAVVTTARIRDVLSTIVQEPGTARIRHHMAIAHIRLHHTVTGPIRHHRTIRSIPVHLMARRHTRQIRTMEGRTTAGLTTDQITDARTTVQIMPGHDHHVRHVLTIVRTTRH